MAGCEESAVGHQMGSGCTVCSPVGKGERGGGGGSAHRQPANQSES